MLVVGSVAAGQNVFMGRAVAPSCAFARAAVAGGWAIGTSASTMTVAVVVWVLPCSSALTVTGYEPAGVPNGSVTVSVDATPAKPYRLGRSKVAEAPAGRSLAARRILSNEVAE